MNRTTEHRIRYRRQWAQQEQRKYFQTDHGARQFLRRLCGDGRPDLAPLEHVVHEVRRVGPWEQAK
jgi:hypothetical protein